MYKLLLVTGDRAILDAFAVVKWEDLGFRQPRIVATAEEAVSSLMTNYCDAIAIGLDAEEEAPLIRFLLEKKPDLPIMAVSDMSGHVETYALELRKVLRQINSDMSNTSFTPAEMLQVSRHQFFRTLMDRRVTDAATIKRVMRLLRSKMDPNRPCVMAELSMPQGSDFIKGRWQYGSERLELALRNIFGVEVQGLRILSCVLPGDRIVLLGCPMLANDGAEDASMTSIITQHVNDCINHVDEFLGLDLAISSIRILPALTAMAMQQD